MRRWRRRINNQGAARALACNEAKETRLLPSSSTRAAAAGSSEKGAKKRRRSGVFGLGTAQRIANKKAQSAKKQKNAQDTGRRPLRATLNFNSLYGIWPQPAAATIWRAMWPCRRRHTPTHAPPSPSLSRGESVYLFVYAFSVFAIRQR